MKHLISLFTCLACVTSAFANNDNVSTNNQVCTNNDAILHAWCWSFNSIKENLNDISKAGYTMVQTSPANECIIGENGGMQLFGNGKWYYHYQPTDWTIGNYQMGTKEDFKHLCDEAKKYNIRVIVDVLPNHTAIDRSTINARLDSAVHGRQNLFHANGLTPITDYNDRFQCTTGEMGKLPDVNTENPDFQYYYMQYVNDLINCGARGFRYDTAKHIGLPSDPLDAKSKQNDFWPVVMGQKSVNGLSLGIDRDSLFVYGEVLQDKNVKELEYGEYMDLTASNYGHVLRNILNKHNAKAENLLNWHHPLNPFKLVTWVESHDTYCNEHESAAMSDNLVRMGYVFLTARQNGTPLFFSRPDGSTRDNYWGNNQIGKRGNDSFKNPQIAAVNKFRKAMAGVPESLSYSEDGGQIVVERGNKGAAIINITDAPVYININTTLPDGKYKDSLFKNSFQIKNGKLIGKLKPLTSYIIYTKK